MNVDELFVYSKGLSVLFVEDDPVVKESTAKIIKKFYKDVMVCTNGEEALIAYQKQQYDILITDLHTERMNGVELIYAIKKINPHQNILVLSGFIDDFAKELQQLDINAVLLKPYRLSKLLYALLKISENVSIMKEFLLKPDTTTNKISANKYLQNITKNQELNEKVTLDIEQLLLLSDAIEKILVKMIHDKFNPTYLEELSDIAHKISNCFSDFKEFDIITETLFEFASFLLNNVINKSQNEQTYLMIECLFLDIKTFIDNMFVTKDVNDINYFNDSFQNNFEALRLESQGTKKEKALDIIFL